MKSTVLYTEEIDDLEEAAENFLKRLRRLNLKRIL